MLRSPALTIIGSPLAEMGPVGVGVFVGIGVRLAVTVGCGVAVGDNSANEEHAKPKITRTVNRKFGFSCSLCLGVC